MGHALLSASGASRWMACPPSARAEAALPDQTSSYAAEGTTAHRLAEIDLLKHMGRITGKDYNLARADVELNEHFNAEMSDYMEEYTDAVVERINAAGRAEVLLEEKLDYSMYVKEGYGTGDVVLIYDGTVEVIDLKYGKGVRVDAEENPQMRLYGLGALEAYDMLYNIETVKMTVMQPRLNHTSTEELTADELRVWADEVVRPAAEKAFAGEGEFKAGDHCKFCKLKATCRARAAANLELAKYDFAEGPELSADEISDILEKAENLKNWVTDVQSYALDQAENHNVKYPGYKLVEGRSNRKYLDDEKVAATLTAQGYEEIYEKKLLGITKLEKAIGKKTVSEVLADLIIKPPGKPALVPLSDKRPEMNSVENAVRDFEEE